MNKLLTWLFGTKPESKEDQDKRVAEINSTLNKLQSINDEIKKNEKELSAINKYLNA